MTGITLEAWAELDENAPGELVDGHVVEEEVPSVLHEAVVAWFIRVLSTWAVRRGGWVLGSRHKLGLAPGLGRKPDVSMYLAGTRLPAKRTTLSRTPPTVVIEVSSSEPSDVRRDRVDKLGEYAKFGVRWYWLLNPELRVLEILELYVDKHFAVALLASDGRHPVPGCDGLALDLDALWAEIDRLPEDEETEESMPCGVEPTGEF